ncbi:hypothetical protein SU69_06940 [Thermosipho melanesiensis]|uniref:Cell division protein ZapA n=2 Tax=Thermosipho melanesiensis TaxID=46541 RepID=A6LMR7_THEM4|nr:hypothetical protein [Thermosipho melanesiensis]ABR31218.1 hypothetical protein Tmel_1371 [Thermosipho melanesiensis BI429]APT74302.1 hypothetical protein BW47_07265 [Thermosipho melanesiensis]OOC36243.1 hypothetical protein SU68_07010 [Thermosipho melanesiensis]OOC37061.1 hypothetical protein SU69_06940 [Thermosipho melanesiensis]OOC37813.1 hypothetical protein SU70_06950 [Thermosipho melanesiensis]
MVKKKLEFNGKRFIVESDVEHEVLDYIEKRLYELNKKYETLSSLDERFLAILCELVEREFDYLREISKLSEKIKNLEAPNENRSV